MALTTKSLCGFHSLPTPLGERRSRKEGIERVKKGKQGDRRVVGGGAVTKTQQLYYQTHHIATSQLKLALPN